MSNCFIHFITLLKIGQEQSPAGLAAGTKTVLWTPTIAAPGTCHRLSCAGNAAACGGCLLGGGDSARHKIGKHGLAGGALGIQQIEEGIDGLVTDEIAVIQIGLFLCGVDAEALGLGKGFLPDEVLAAGIAVAEDAQHQGDEFEVGHGIVGLIGGGGGAGHQLVLPGVGGIGAQPVGNVLKGHLAGGFGGLLRNAEEVEHKYQPFAAGELLGQLHTLGSAAHQVHLPQGKGHVDVLLGIGIRPGDLVGTGDVKHGAVLGGGEGGAGLFRLNIALVFHHGDGSMLLARGSIDNRAAAANPDGTGGDHIGGAKRAGQHVALIEGELRAGGAQIRGLGTDKLFIGFLCHGGGKPVLGEAQNVIVIICRDILDEGILPGKTGGGLVLHALNEGGLDGFFNIALGQQAVPAGKLRRDRQRDQRQHQNENKKKRKNSAAHGELLSGFVEGDITSVLL